MGYLKSIINESYKINNKELEIINKQKLINSKIKNSNEFYSLSKFGYCTSDNELLKKDINKLCNKIKSKQDKDYILLEIERVNIHFNENLNNDKIINKSKIKDYKKWLNNIFKPMILKYQINKLNESYKGDENMYYNDECSILESNVSKYKQIPINDDSINKFKDIYKPLSHLRSGNNYDGIILFNGTEIVGFVNVKKDDNFIQALEVNPKYRGQKISHDLLNLAINKYKATKLSVRKTNDIAISLYKKHGFKKSDENEYQYIMSLNESSDVIQEFLFKKTKKKEIDNKAIINMIDSEEFLNKYHKINFKKCVELQPKVIKIILDNYPDLLKKKVFEKSDLSDYKNINNKDIRLYLSGNNHISYPLVDWDLWAFTPRARDNEETDKFWVMYHNIVKKIKEIFKDSDFIIDDNGDWDGGSITIEYIKPIKITENINESSDVILQESTSYQKKYSCPYCNERKEREKLISHIDAEHSDLIPEGFTSTRVVFNIINKKEKGKCVQCGKETEWNEDNKRYDRYCSEKCISDYKKMRDERMKKVYGKVYLLDDEEFQKKMLEGRSISGTYKFSDGGVRSYVGTYERNLLEFLDKVMEFHSKDIITPGYTVVYDYNGEKHKWILDVYIVPFNLQIDAKDGGSNPNRREMPEYRSKQISKELAIREQKEFNYLRLTDNNFTQLMTTLLQIKNSLQSVNDDKIVNINEYMAMGGCNKVVSSNDTYIVPCMLQNTFVEPVYSKDKFLSNMYRLIDGKLTLTTREELKKNFKIPTKILKLSNTKVDNIIEELYFKQQLTSHRDIFKELTGHELIDKNQYFFDESFKFILEGFYEHEMRCNIIESTIINKFNNISIPVLEQTISQNECSLKYPLIMKQDYNGYFVENGKSKNRSKSYITINEIPIEVMDFLLNDDSDIFDDKEFNL